LLTGPKFARAAYALFGVAVLAALLKLGDISGAEPVVLRTAPATPVTKSGEAAASPGEVSKGTPLYLPETERASTRTPARSVAFADDASVFYRPSPEPAAREADEGRGEPVCGDLGDFSKGSRAVFPLSDAYFNSYEDTWGAPRPPGGHEGADLMSPAGTPEFAITDGTIVPVSGANKNGWNRLGGYTVMLKAAYDIGPIQKGDLFYYAHLNEESALPIGARVRAGQQMGLVGDTGEGPEGTRGKFPSHLHFGWYDTGFDSSRTNLESGAMNPYPLLLWLEQNGGAVSGGTDTAYCEAQGPEPSTDEDHWPSPDSPGTRPDLDTGDPHDARPSPIIEESRQDQPQEREGEPDQEEEPYRLGGRIGLASEERDEDMAEESEKEDEKEDERDEPSAREEDEPAEGEDKASPQTVEEDSLEVDTGKKVRFFLSDPARPDHLALRRYHASILAEALRNREENRDDRNRDGRDNSVAPQKKKHKKPKKPPNSLGRREHKEDRPASKPDNASARPVPHKKDSGGTPIPKENREPKGAEKGGAPPSELDGRGQPKDK